MPNLSWLDFFHKQEEQYRELNPPKEKKPRRKRTDVTATRVNVCADFETTTIAEDCRVWAWGLADTEKPFYDDVEIGTDIGSFMERISQVNSNCYFHNLRFDGAFLLDWLLKNGYTHTLERARDKGEFSSLISDMGKFYSITVHWKNGYTTEFRDSLKKLPMGVRRVAQAFKLEMSKGDIDYEAPRPVGHVLTEEEIDYLKRDVSIIAQAMKEIIDSGMKKLTIGSDALAEYKNIVSSKLFEKTFPVLHYDIDRDIRRAYRGGFTYADDRFKGRVVGNGLVLDVNSLYPSVMRYKMIPYGTPIFGKGYIEPTEQYPLVIFSITFTAKLKPNHIPCIQIKGTNMFIGTEYLKEITEPTTLAVSNVDWDLYNDHYDIDVIAFHGGWRFRATSGMFDSYIDKWSEIKAKETGGKREIAKLHLNSLYGKFASNPNVTSKIPILEDNKVRLIRGESETRDPVYTAAGVFITAWARDITIRAAQVNYDTFAYADTDSLHLLQSEIPDSLTVHPTELGAWKHEYDFDAAYYIRPKAYLELKSDGKYENRIAGLPTAISEQLTFDDLVEGKILHGKLTPKTVPGGVVLQDVPFELKLR